MEEQPGSLLPEGWGGMPAHLPDPAHALQPYPPLTHQGPGSKLRMSVLVNSYSSVKTSWVKPPTSALPGRCPSISGASSTFTVFGPPARVPSASEAPARGVFEGWEPHRDTGERLMAGLVSLWPPLAPGPASPPGPAPVQPLPCTSLSKGPPGLLWLQRPWAP